MKKGKDGVCGNLYPQIEVEEEPEGWIKLEFILIEESWAYANFEDYFKIKDVVYNLQLKINGRHGRLNQKQKLLVNRIKNLNIYTDEGQTQKLEQFDQPLGQIFFTKGAKEKQHAPLFQVYFSFDPELDCPLLLTGIK